jgi:hypothetical protein
MKLTSKILDTVGAVIVGALGITVATYRVVTGNSPTPSSWKEKDKESWRKWAKEMEKKKKQL